MAGPGYDRTLGEALVSEGLAGHFVQRLFGNPPEPWEHAVGVGEYPRWLGYTLGYAIVGKWLGSAREPDVATLVNVPAHTVLLATWSDVRKPILLPA